MEHAHNDNSLIVAPERHEIAPVDRLPQTAGQIVATLEGTGLLGDTVAKSA